MVRSMFLAGTLLCSAPLLAQAGTPATVPGAGGLGGLMGGALPNVGSVGAGNAAGLLGYCVKNNLLGANTPVPSAATNSAANATPAAGASGARSVLQRLTGRQEVQSSPGYAAGQAGQIQAPSGRTLSLGSLCGQAKAQLCKLVLNRAKSFL